MEKDEFFVKSQIRSNIESVRDLLNTGIFGTPVLIIFQEPVFVSIILKLNDLLQKFNQLDNRINFTEDIKSGDITELVRNTRNAICHLDSEENLLEKGSNIKFVFNMIIGKGKAMAVGDSVVASSDYEDDIAFFYGENRIYLNRHLVRIISEAIVIFRKLYSEEILF